MNRRIRSTGYANNQKQSIAVELKAHASVPQKPFQRLSLISYRVFMVFAWFLKNRLQRAFTRLSGTNANHTVQI